GPHRLPQPRLLRKLHPSSPRHPFPAQSYLDAHDDCHAERRWARKQRRSLAELGKVPRPAVSETVQKLEEAPRVRNPDSDRDDSEKLDETTDDRDNPHASSAPVHATRSQRVPRHPFFGSTESNSKYAFFGS